MRLSDIPRLTDQLPQIDELISLLADSEPHAVEIEGLTGTARSMAAVRLWQRLNRTMLIVTHSPENANRLWDDLTRLGVAEDRLVVLPAAQSLMLEGDITDTRVIGERIAALHMASTSDPGIVIGSVEAVLQFTAPPGNLSLYSFTTAVGDEVDLPAMVRRLVDMGYMPAATVSRPGEFSRRGGILDVFPAAETSPIRIELFGDIIESLRIFDVSTQRSLKRQVEVTITPAREIRLTSHPAGLDALRMALKERIAELVAAGSKDAADRLNEKVRNDIALLEQGSYFDGLEQYIRWLLPQNSCALDHFGNDVVIVLDEPKQIALHWERLSADMISARERHWEFGETLDRDPAFLDFEVAVQQMRSHPIVVLASLGRVTEGLGIRKRLEINCGPTDVYRGRLPGMADEIGTWLDNECRVLLTTEQPHRVREICAELQLPLRSPDAALTPGSCLIVLEGSLRAGFKIDELRLFVLTDAELFGAARPVQARRKVAGGTPISSVLDLKERDLVVHIHHGIGIYRGMVKRRNENFDRDYLLIEYQGGDRLYVPADQIDRLQRYQALEGQAPQVSKIGGADWQRTRKKVREQARQMAAELIKLYAAREASSRPAFGPDTTWQAEMEDAFPYVETPSQLRAINDVKQDMERARPMDRLICGDVGFGKTEVAVRAAFKAVSAGKQVAILCPTTVLAAQHHTTFSSRLAAYPISVELLSRFRSRQEQLETVKGLKRGTVDIVVATHRLLSKDVEFPNLGLVIVDEEQRFGVAHKERLKQLRTSVDVLTLSATPIPRTLSMALSGLRDMSVIEDAPEGRMPVLTFVREFENDTVQDAILRELERDGQIYYVHNRVESIFHVAAHLRKLVPELRIEVGHGQMSEEELEQVMYRFYHHEADLLLCTTIIENGLDIPNANTIIVDNADHLGLAQLYQLRGRVGRSNRQAYAYMLYRRSKLVSEVAEHRLNAIKEFTALGSGHKVAMRDLEIRGAGNLLGAEQSGAIVSVGFDLYCRLLAQAVQELKGEEPEEDILPSIDLPITAFIPGDYIPGEAERIYFYKRMSAVRSVQDIEDLQAELEDRFGDPPKAVWQALNILRLRLRCRDIGVASIKGEQLDVHIRFAPHVRLAPRAIQLLGTALRGMKFLQDGVVVPIKSTKVIDQIEETVEVIARALSFPSTPTPAGARK